MCNLVLSSPRLRFGLQTWSVFFFSFSLLINMPLVAESHQIDIEHQSDLQWHEWGKRAFARAQAEDKLILLDLTAVWCHACHVMDQTTYADPTVRTLLHDHFVPIRVDTDQRPDLETRYKTSGWPTTNVLLPTGEILFQANSLEPDVMITLLQEAKMLYETEKADLTLQAAKLRDHMETRVKKKPENGAWSSSVVAQSVAMMKREFDAVNGGFRDHPKFFEPDAIQMAMTYGFFEPDRELVNMGLTTLKRQMLLLDTVWGGFYRYAEQADWRQPHYEKMLHIQAQNLENYITAYQLTGNTEFKHIAHRIIDYVERFLRDPQTGQFFESQDADVRDETGMALVSGDEFFSWDWVHRKARGFPRVDQKIYTGSNADMAWAYFHAAPVLKMPSLQDRAHHILKRILLERLDPEKGLRHETGDGSVNLHGLLSDHVRLGRALIAGFRTTEDQWFLEQSEDLANLTQTLLGDPNGGGYFDRPSSSDDVGLLSFQTKPPRENIQMARWNLDLFHLTGRETYRLNAERTLQGVVGTPQPLPIALIGLAADEWFRPPIHIAVIGRTDDTKTQSLRNEAVRLYCPRKIIKVFDPQKGPMKWGAVSFPYEGKAVAFVCTDQMCLPPVNQPEIMKDRLNELLADLRKSTL